MIDARFEDSDVTTGLRQDLHSSSQVSLVSLLFLLPRTPGGRSSERHSSAERPVRDRICCVMGNRGHREARPQLFKPVPVVADPELPGGRSNCLGVRDIN